MYLLCVDVSEFLRKAASYWDLDLDSINELFLESELFCSFLSLMKTLSAAASWNYFSGVSDTPQVVWMFLI